jgi:hypothetical protein
LKISERSAGVGCPFDVYGIGHNYRGIIKFDFDERHPSMDTPSDNPTFSYQFIYKIHFIISRHPPYQTPFAPFSIPHSYTAAPHEPASSDHPQTNNKSSVLVARQ